jgi:hypothetical protein
MPHSPCFIPLVNSLFLSLPFPFYLLGNPPLAWCDPVHLGLRLIVNWPPPSHLLPIPSPFQSPNTSGQLCALHTKTTSWSWLLMVRNKNEKSENLPQPFYPWMLFPWHIWPLNFSFLTFHLFPWCTPRCPLSAAPPEPVWNSYLRLRKSHLVVKLRSILILLHKSFWGEFIMLFLVLDTVHSVNKFFICPTVRV